VAFLVEESRVYQNQEKVYGLGTFGMELGNLKDGGKEVRV
jgi:hypothetical protein